MAFDPEANPKDYIIIKGASVHNLKKLDVTIPRNRMVVITGLSGSGKSSLAFDTLYAEGQRRYVESLSAYARQFIGRMDKPEVEFVKGISPAIAIEQKVNVRNPRSTVGTSTEIYDYLKLLFARIGKTFSPVSGKEVRKHTISDVTDFCSSQEQNVRIMMFAPLVISQGRTIGEELSVLLQKGFTRVAIDGKVSKIEDIAGDYAKKTKSNKSKAQADLWVLIDRFTTDSIDDEFKSRIADSAQTAFFEGRGTCHVQIQDDKDVNSIQTFSNRFESDGMTFEEPSVNLFSFNNPYGACKNCEGFGSVIGIDEDLVVPDKSLSVYDGAIMCWRGEKMKEWNEALIKVAHKFNFPIHRPYYQLNKQDRDLLWKGNSHFKGINEFFQFLEENNYKIQYRVMLSRYRGKTACPECHGTRLRSDANYVKVNGHSITELVLMPVDQCLVFFENIELSDYESKVASRILTEITSRLRFLKNVGLGYLTLNRLSNSLSGGESQRINLATSLGSSLVGSMYILDEPSIGLHPRDTERLIGVLRDLQKLGNTVIIVEHDEEIMRAADQLIDIGPMAGTNGGQLVFQGDFMDIMKSEGLTGGYLSKRLSIPIPERRRKWKKYIEIQGARENNLQNVSVKFPLGILTAVTGVSGSGKTSLVKKILYPAIKKTIGGYGEQTGNFDKLTGDYGSITDAELVDQNPIGKSSRSNPVTYVKAYDEIRALFADMPQARNRNLKPSHFSFNVEGGRCDVCQGEGTVTIEMQFMADIHLKCDSCGGRRFKDDVLAVEFQGMNIDQILGMTVDDAIAFFNSPVKSKHSNQMEKVAAKLQPLADVGLGYVRLGQSSSTLSGGEAQRIKLASFIGRGQSSTGSLFIFDEPTTGLHFHDIHKLLDAFNALIKQGNSIIVIEHNPEIIKSADWVIDLGPDGGINGGLVVFEGTPEDLVKDPKSLTGKFLKDKIA